SVDHHVADVAQAVAGLGGAPHHHAAHLLILEQAADLDAGEQGGRRAAHVAGPQAALLGLGAVYPGLQRRLPDRPPGPRLGHAADAGDRLAHVLALLVEHVVLVAVNPDDHVVLTIGDHVAAPFAQVGLHRVAYTRVAFDDVLDRRRGPVVVGSGIHRHPHR